MGLHRAEPAMIRPTRCVFCGTWHADPFLAYGCAMACRRAIDRGRALHTARRLQRDRRIGRVRAERVAVRSPAPKPKQRRKTRPPAADTARPPATKPDRTITVRGFDFRSRYDAAYTLVVLENNGWRGGRCTEKQMKKILKLVDPAYHDQLIQQRRAWHDWLSAPDPWIVRGSDSDVVLFDHLGSKRPVWQRLLPGNSFRRGRTRSAKH